jgi:hypothetical protein
MFKIYEDKIIERLHFKHYREMEFKPLDNSYLKSYLAGLWEGDGNIIFNYNVLKTPYFYINFHRKDIPLALSLQNKFGGSTEDIIKEDVVVWSIHTKKDIINIIKILNGKLRTPKIYQFNKLIDHINNDYDKNIPKYLEDQSDLNSNAWFAGYFDADGGFKIRYTEKLLDNNNKTIRKGRIEVRITIEKKQYDYRTGKSYKEIMSNIAQFLTSNKENFNFSKHNGQLYFIVEGFSLDKLQIIKNYLNKYPLLSKKNNDYIDWCMVYDIISKKEHLTEKGKNRIKFIKSRMNDNRIDIDWSHLNYIK